MFWALFQKKFSNFRFIVVNSSTIWRNLNLTFTVITPCGINVSSQADKPLYRFKSYFARSLPQKSSIVVSSDIHVIRVIYQQILQGCHVSLSRQSETLG